MVDLVNQHKKIQKDLCKTIIQVKTIKVRGKSIFAKVENSWND